MSDPDLIALAEEARQLRNALGASSHTGGRATVTVDMGGWSLPVCAAIAVICLFVALDARQDAAELRAEARDLRRKVERREDYLNMLWQRYPELRPEKVEATPK